MPSWYPRAEQLVLDWLRAGNSSPVFTETDENLASLVPALKVQVFGGGSSAQMTRSPSVEICAYAVGRGAALDLMDAADRRMMALAGAGFESRFVDDVRLLFHPSVEPYANTGLHQATATYTIDIRPQ